MGKRDESEVERLRRENERLLKLLRDAGLGAAAVQADHAREIGERKVELRQVISDARSASEQSARDLVVAAARSDELLALYDALSRAERRQAAIVELNDRFRETEEAAQLAEIASEVLGRTLGTSRAAYGVVAASTEWVTISSDWRRDGMSSVAGRYRFADFGSFIENLRRGETVIIDDVQADERTVGHTDRLAALEIRALLNVPVMERGRLQAILLLHDNQPRHWSEEKLAFVRDVAQRTHEAVERRRGDEHQRVLQHELQHRVKNTLAMVQAIAGQTFRQTESASARETFVSRIVALSQANDVLTRSGWAAAQVKDIVIGATIPHCAPAERFTLSGPAIEVAANAALAFTLALHELCTNASKYGAFSSPNGHVTVEWNVDQAGSFRLRWTEQGGPPVQQPTRKGFGSRLIERSLGPQLGGEVTTDYAPTGLVFTVVAPLAAVQEEAGHP